jgi:hypothetical protein
VTVTEKATEKVTEKVTEKATERVMVTRRRSYSSPKPSSGESAPHC